MMKKLLLLCLFLLLMLVGCAQDAEPALYTNALQEYSEYQLHYNHWSAAAWAEAKGFAFETAMLDPTTDHLIVRYRSADAAFELELEPVTEAAQPDRQLELCMGATELTALVPGDAEYPWYRLHLRSEDMSAAELWEDVTLYSSAASSHKFRKESVTSEVSRAKRLDGILRCRDYDRPTLQRGGDTLEFELLAWVSYETMPPIVQWKVQRFHCGQWRDTRYQGGTEANSGWLELELPDGFYQLCVLLEDGQEGNLLFGVGTLDRLCADDLPYGVKDDTIEGLWLDAGGPYPHDAPYFTYCVRMTNRDYRSFDHDDVDFIEVRLDGRWRALPYTNFSSLLIPYYVRPQSPEDMPEQHMTGCGDNYLFDLVPGQYRVKLHGELNGSLYHKQVVTGEFTILPPSEGDYCVLDRLGQRYSETELPLLTDHVGAWRRGREVNGFVFEAAGLDRISGNFIVVYSNGTERFWIETTPVTASGYRKDTLMFTPETEESQISYYTYGCERYPYVQIDLRSETMSEDEIAAAIDSIWLCRWSDAGHEIHAPQFTGRSSEIITLHYPRFSHKDTDQRWIKSGGDTLCWRIGQPATAAKLWRYFDGQWRDTGLFFAVDGSEGTLELDLSAGYYQLVFPVSENESHSYPFCVGKPGELGPRDLPPGRLTGTARDVTLQVQKQTMRDETLTVGAVIHYGPEADLCPAKDARLEIELQSRWCALPCFINAVDNNDYMAIQDRSETRSYRFSNDPASRHYYLLPLDTGNYRIVTEGNDASPLTRWVAAEFHLSPKKIESTS